MNQIRIAFTKETLETLSNAVMVQPSDEECAIDVVIDRKAKCLTEILGDDVQVLLINKSRTNTVEVDPEDVQLNFGVEMK